MPVLGLWVVSCGIGYVNCDHVPITLDGKNNKCMHLLLVQ